MVLGEKKVILFRLPDDFRHLRRRMDKNQLAFTGRNYRLNRGGIKRSILRGSLAGFVEHDRFIYPQGLHPFDLNQIGARDRTWE